MFFSAIRDSMRDAIEEITTRRKAAKKKIIGEISELQSEWKAEEYLEHLLTFLQLLCENQNSAFQHLLRQQVLYFM